MLSIAIVVLYGCPDISIPYCVVCWAHAYLLLANGWEVRMHSTQYLTLFFLETIASSYGAKKELSLIITDCLLLLDLDEWTKIRKSRGEGIVFITLSAHCNAVLLICDNASNCLSRLQQTLQNSCRNDNQLFCCGIQSQVYTTTVATCTCTSMLLDLTVIVLSWASLMH